MQYTYFAANKRRRPNDGLMLTHCLRRLLSPDLNLELGHIACLLRPCRIPVFYSVNQKHEACNPNIELMLGKRRTQWPSSWLTLIKSVHFERVNAIIKR